MGRLTVTDAQVTEAGRRIAAGELQRDIAAEFGISGRALYARLVKLGIPRSRVGRRKAERLNHCRTCRCVGEREARP